MSNSFLISYLKKVSVIAYLFLYQPSEANTFEEAYNELLRGNFYPDLTEVDTPHKEYLELYAATLRYIIVEDLSFEAIENEFEKKLSVIEESESTGPDHLYFEADSRVKYGVILAKNNQRLEGAWQIRQAYKAIERNLELFPDHVPSLKTLGLLQAGLGAVPEKYQWLISLAGMEGSVNKGLKNLNMVARSKSTYAEETRVIQILAHAYVLDQPDQALNILKSISITTPLIDLVARMVFIKTSHSSEVIKLPYRARSFTVNDYLTAEAHFQAGLYHQAKNLYQNYIEAHKGHSYLADSYYKLYLISLFLRSPDDTLLNKTISAPSTPTLADRQAINLSSQPLKTLGLIQLRFATDGGFFELADSIQQTLKVPDNEKLELNYRRARLFQKMGAWAQANKLFRQVIHSQYDNEYYGPNSALQLGLYFLDIKNNDSSAYYLQLAKNYRRHPYENSIEAKAEAALNRLKEYSDD